jgi:hypothetical protein
MGHDVFISYSNRDKTVADAACSMLEGRGLRCWIAPRDIAPGVEWAEAIIAGINGARVFVLVFSGHANASPQVRREVERAVNRGLAIVPFRIEDVLPSGSLEYFLGAPHWLDALTPPLQRHLERLADAVARLLGRAESSSPPAPPPVKRRTDRLAGAAAWAAFLGAGGAIVYAALPRSAPTEAPADDLTVPDSANAASANAAEPAPPAAEPPLEALLSFFRVGLGSDGYIDASGPLRNATIPTGIAVSPAGARLVFIGTGHLPYLAPSGYGTLGEIKPDGPVLLALQTQADGPAFLELSFDEPLREVRLTMPRVEPTRGPSAVVAGTAFPALTVRALASRGEVIAERSYRPWGARDLQDVERRTITLTAPAAEGIRALRIRAGGWITTDTMPYAAARARSWDPATGPEPLPAPPPPPFNSILFVEEIAVRRMPAAPRSSR